MQAVRCQAPDLSSPALVPGACRPRVRRRQAPAGFIGAARARLRKVLPRLAILQRRSDAISGLASKSACAERVLREKERRPEK